MSNGLFFCLAAFILSVFASRKSLGWGVSAVLFVGYGYGIARANYPDGASHFIFDAALLGFYFVQFSKPVSDETHHATADARLWLLFLMAWPLILFLLPINHYLIQLVGLHHIVLLMPALLLGARARPRTLDSMATAVAVLNVIAFGFALYEYHFGMPSLYPHNAVTDIMYRSHDIRTAEGRFFRLPATFTSAHSFGAMMVQGMPFLWNGMVDSSKPLPRRVAMTAAAALSILGIFIAGPRFPVAALGIWAMLMLFLPGLKLGKRFMLGVVMVFIGLFCAYYVVADARMQRFTSLGNLDMVEARSTGSSGFDLAGTLLKYPLGVGLGGAWGSSIPFFLKHLAPEPIGAENEYIRIAVEQGIVGMLIWGLLAFRLVRKRPRAISPRWWAGTHAVWALLIMNFATAFVGAGMFQVVPASFLIYFQLGMLLRVPSPDALPEKAGGDDAAPRPAPGAAAPRSPVPTVLGLYPEKLR